MMSDVIIWTHTIVHLSANGLQGECMSTVHYSYHGGLESARPLPPLPQTGYVKIVPVF